MKRYAISRRKSGGPEEFLKGAGIGRLNEWTPQVDDDYLFDNAEGALSYARLYLDKSDGALALVTIKLRVAQRDLLK